LTMLHLLVLYLPIMLELAGGSPLETIPLWELVMEEKLADLLTMLHLGIIQLLEFQPLSKESPSETIHLWQ
ncbi:MAG: hypothetical protein P8R40_10215, partial [SAR324 cluster bacterium]|nr:hypothetical protein [SAR324 cluster bacterium]